MFRSPSAGGENLSRRNSFPSPEDIEPKPSKPNPVRLCSATLICVSGGLAASSA
jgi:hypothetical protein